MPDTLHATLTPDAVTRSGSWTVVGAASAQAALSDTDNLTYVTTPSAVAGVDGTMRLSFGDAATVASDTIITVVKLVYNAAMSTGSGTVQVVLALADGTAIGTAFGPLSATPTSAIFSLARPGGGDWTIADVNGLTVALVGAPVGTTRVYRVHLEVYKNTIPVVVATSPTATVTTVANASDPQLVWTYFDLDSDLQEFIRIKLFSGTAFVTDPETETARLLVDTGDLKYTATSIGAQAQVNGSYRWAVKVRSEQSTAWSAWSQRALDYDLPSPLPPSITATPNPTLNRYDLVVTATAGPNPTEFVAMQRSENSGVTWRQVFGASKITYAGPVSISEYYSPRMSRAFAAASFGSVNYNAPQNYNAGVGYNGNLMTAAVGPANVVRFRARSGRMFNGATLWSQWQEVNPLSLVGDGTTWLKHPHDPTKSITIQQVANWETTSEEDMSVLRAAGRADWVVMSGVIGFLKGDIEMIFGSDAAYAAFVTLRAFAIPLLLQTCFGDSALDQTWVRLGPVSSVVRVTTGPSQKINQYRRVKVGFVETKTPPAPV